MRLYSETFGSLNNESQPTLVFLHGLLGSGQDWRHVVNTLSSEHLCITIDLPGHGKSQMVQAIDFAHVNQLILQTLFHRNIEQYVLIGYSMGARLAMYHAASIHPNAVPHSGEKSACKKTPQLMGVVIEGGHFGLPQVECAARFANDQKWAQRFTYEPLSLVLPDWYQQAVFSSLNHDQRQSLVLKRSGNLSSGVARMLLATSLAKQPQLQQTMEALVLPTIYVCGERDKKFKRLVEDTQLQYQVIASAGHNVHVEQPYAFSMAINNFVKQIGINHG
jgi:2-succinyl-6-hydroxy-2,4-cyclohexadiene-1-carboxylate synthase